MPGTPEEYAANPDTDAAAAAIDQALADGAADGQSIIQALQDQGMRVYPEGEMPGDPLEAAGGPPPPEEDDELAMMDEGPGLEAPPMMGGGRDDDIMAAVGAAQKNDAANKEKFKATMM